MEQEFNGQITEGGDYNELRIGGEALAAEAQDFDSTIVSLRYYISNRPIDRERVVEEMLRTFYEGERDANGSYVYGSSWTGCYARNNRLEVGGHDIIEELTSHMGEYCYLIIETED